MTKQNLKRFYTLQIPIKETSLILKLLGSDKEIPNHIK